MTGFVFVFTLHTLSILHSLLFPYHSVPLSFTDHKFKVVFLWSLHSLDSPYYTDYYIYYCIHNYWLIMRGLNTSTKL